MGTSDKDVKSWDQRLSDQVNRGWENYIHRRIDLSTARADEPFLFAGEFLYVEESSGATAVAKIKLNRNTNDSLDLEKGVEIKTIFTIVHISNEALQDEWIDLVFGINFEYKKKIIDSIGGLLNFLSGGPITTPAGVDLRIVPGAGGITQIGDAGATSRGLVNNDDLFVAGKFEVDGYSWFDDRVYFSANGFELTSYGGVLSYRSIYSIITIAIGNSVGVSGINLAPADSIIMGVAARVGTAPGGGPSHFDVGRTAGGNLDEYIDNQAVALGGRFNIAAHGDGSHAGPHYQAANDTITITTTDGAGAPVNVAGADMVVRVMVWNQIMEAPTY